MQIKKYIKDIEDFPKKGIIFRDISPLLASHEAFSYVIDNISKKYSKNTIDKIVGLDARGFIFGSVVSYKTGIPFVMVRKPGKLPDRCVSIDYELEYGINTFEIHKNSINKDDRILIIDDLLATGGSLTAVSKLLTKLGAKIQAYECIVELGFLNARNDQNFEINSQVIYD
ncbi:MAG: adenine phosphoribosyltransferase [PS1 clade bacterium]|jgi:adenine phosphoribosyltransferase